MPELSIIIPAYNVEKYLDKIIPTLTYNGAESDIEVLIINDGSRDNTVNIAETLIKDKSWFKIINKQNGGHGSVINRGIMEATGRYFKVVDGDDWVDTNELVKLVQFLKNSTADLIVTNYTEVEDISFKEHSVYTFHNIEYGRIYDENVLNAIDRYIGIHSFTVKTSILKDNHIRVSENVFYEDTQYVLFPIPYIRSIVFVNYNVYKYRIASATQSVNPKNMVKNRAHRVVVMKGLVDYYLENTKMFSNSAKTYYFFRMKIAAENQFKIYMGMHTCTQGVYKELEEYSSIIKKSEDFYNYFIQHAGPFSKCLIDCNYNGYRRIVHVYSFLDDTGILHIKDWFISKLRFVKRKVLLKG